MLTTFSAWIYRLSGGAVTFLAILIFNFFILWVMPAQAQQAASISQGAGSPDMSFIYSPADLYTMADRYGAEGRAAYVHARWSFDLIFPVIYLYFLATCISWLMARAVPGADSRWRLLNLFPVFGCLFDYLENIAASIVMMNYPSPTILWDWLAPVFTFIKWIGVGGSFVILIPAALLALRSRMQKRSA